MFIEDFNAKKISLDNRTKKIKREKELNDKQARRRLKLDNLN